VSQEDILWGVETAPRGVVSQTGAAKADRTRSSDAGPCSYDDFDTTKIAVLQVVGLIKGENAIHLARVYGEKKRNFPGKGVLRVDRR
jgi:hypothetical protein